MIKKYHFILIGGDKRFQRLSELLVQNQCSASVYGTSSDYLPTAKRDSTTGQLEVPNGKIPIIILPIPLLRPAGFINNPLGNKPILLWELDNLLPPNAWMISGPIPEKLQGTIKMKHILSFNLLHLPSFSKYNSITTAEGSVMEAIRNSDRNISKSNCIVLGYGCCGKTLAKLLSGFHPDSIIVTGRREETRKEAMEDGFTYVPTNEISQILSTCDFLFNTIPSPVLSTKQLQILSPHCLLIDIASAPGGWSHKTAKEMGLNSDLYPGLPGRVSAYSSGEYLFHAIIEIIEKKESEHIHHESYE